MSILVTPHSNPVDVLSNVQVVNIFDQAFTINGFLVPEPASVALFSLGMVGVGWLGVRRRKH
jgi:hypothetical protein